MTVNVCDDSLDIYAQLSWLKIVRFVKEARGTRQQQQRGRVAIEPAWKAIRILPFKLQIHVASCCALILTQFDYVAEFLNIAIYVY